MTRLSRRRVAVAALVLGTLLSVDRAGAELPTTRLKTVFPAGAQVGTTVEVQILGTNLAGVDRLLFSHPQISAKQAMAEPGPFDSGPQPVPDRFVVVVPASVPPGSYEVRALGRYGVSNPRWFVVGDLPETVETEPNETRETANALAFGSVVHGRSDRQADVDWFRIPVKKGTRVLVECLAHRADSPLDALVVVEDPTGLEVGNNRTDRQLDPLVDFTAQVDGDHLVRVADAYYRGGTDYAYRLTIGTRPHVDAVFPPAGTAGSTTTFTLLGRNLPGGRPAGLAVDGHPLERLDVPLKVPAVGGLAFDALLEPDAALVDGFEHRLKGPGGTSESFLVGIAADPVVPEAEPNDDPEKAQKLTVPTEVAGRHHPRGDRDWFAFDAKQGEEFVIEVVSSRLGRPTDPTLVIEQLVAGADGKVEAKTIRTVEDSSAGFVSAEFDTRSDDPATRLTIPADGTYRVLVFDSLSGIRSDPRLGYRLIVRPARPDFRLAALPADPQGAVLLRRGGTAGVTVVVARTDGFEGEVEVSVAGLPAGVVAPPVVIGPARTSGTLVLQAAANAPASVSNLQVTGRATVGTTVLVRTARCGTAVDLLAPQQNQPMRAAAARFAAQLPVAVSAADEAPVRISTTQTAVLEMSRAGVLKIPFDLVRSGHDVKVDGTAADLPPNVTGKPVAFDPKVGKGELELTFAANAPLGTYSIHLQAVTTLPFEYDPETAKAAAARKAEVDKIATDTAAADKDAAAKKAAADKLATDTAAAAKTATDAKTAAEQALATAVAAAATATNARDAAKKESDAASVAAKTATDAKTAADKSLATAQANAKAAADRLAQAKSQLAAKSDDKTLAAAVANAEKAVAEANAAVQSAQQTAVQAQTVLAAAESKAKQTADALAGAEKTLTDATAKRTAADQTLKTATAAQTEAQKKSVEAAAAKEAADKVAAAAKEQAAAAVQAKAAADKRATDTAAASKSANIRDLTPSVPVTIRITPAPIVLAAKPPAAPIVQGAQGDVPVSIARLYGSNDPVVLSAKLPPGVGGLQIANVTIPAGQTAAPLKIVAAANATPGTHAVEIAGTVRFNNQTLAVSETVSVTVVAAPPAAAAK